MPKKSRADSPLPTGTVTFLFTDIEGSTALWEQDGARMSQALAAHDALTRSAVERHHGTVVKMTGDGVHAAFDEAVDALTVTLDLQQALADPAATCGLALRVRCGLHTGVVERRDGDYFGMSVNRAARIMSVAHGGQVLLSHAVVDRVGKILPESVSLRDLGKVRLKDLATPEHVYQVVHPGMRQAFPALRSLEATPNNLPQQATNFIGREQALVELKRLLAKTRLLTLTGSGGCGKTRLSLQVAAESLELFPDGAWFVELAPLSDPGLVLQTVATVLGLKEAQGKPIVQALTDHLKDKRLLLLLDNCEHLLDGCAQLADTLVRQCPQVKIVASSREILGIGGEQAYRVPSLSLPDLKRAQTPTTVSKYESAELFVDRALLVHPDFQVTNQNASTLASICYRLDGIPLAIELAAARVRSISVEEIDGKLDQRFRLLTGGSRTALPRQQTLQALIDWSYDLLSDSEKLTLRRLSVFAGGWTLAAAEQVCAGDGVDEQNVLDLLTSLTDKSLVVVVEQNDGHYRYHLLETTRAYALERLAEAGETERMLRRHAEAILALLAAYEKDDRQWRIKPADRVALAAEIDNLRAALAWVVTAAAGTDLVVPLAGVSYHVWHAAIHHAEGLERCLALRRHVHDGVAARDAALYWLAVAKLGLISSEPREGFDAALRAADLYRSLGDDSRRYDALWCAAVLGNSTPERELAIAEATRLERATWPARQRSGLLYARCWWYARLGRFEEALACAHQMVAIVAIHREEGHPVGEQHAMSNVVAMELLLGRPEAALEHARAAVARLDALGAGAAAGFLLWIVMIALIFLNRLDEAVDAGRKARTLLLQEGDKYRLLSALALLAALQGRFAPSAHIIGYDDAYLARTGEGVRPVAALLRARLGPLLDAALPPPELARLRMEGAALDDEQVFQLGFGDGA